MAAILVLFSGNNKLGEQISSLLPIHWILKRVETAAAIGGDPALLPPPGDSLAFWIDTATQKDWPGLLEKLPAHDGSVVAIINDARARDSVLRSGADDYLLRPLLASEIQIRLERSRRDGETIRKLRRRLSERDRQASIGRLTSHICHEINNAMQATRGALALALEEPGLPMELASYLDLCRNETRRVVDLVSRIRRIYHAGNKIPESISIEELLREILSVTAEELENNNTRLVEDLAPGLPPVYGIRDHLYLAFLSLMFNLSEAFRGAGGGEMHVALRMAEGSLPQVLCAEIALHPSGEAPASILPAAEESLGLSPAAEIIRRYDGSVDIRRNGRGPVVRVSLPARQPFRLGEVAIGNDADPDRR
jgi:signal transduction histidine kinase